MTDRIRKLLKRRASVVAASLVLTLFAGACADTAGPEEDAGVEQIQEEFDEADFFNDPDAFVGEQVTVSAEVSTVLGPRSFLLAGEEFGAEALLVVSADEFDVSEGNVVQVTGTVRELNVADFEEDLGVDFGADLGEFEGEPVIVASSVDATVPDEGAS